MVVRRYIDFLIFISIHLLYLLFFAAASLLFVHFFNFSFLFWYFFVIKFYLFNNFFTQYKHIQVNMGIPRQPYKGLHIMFYTRRSTHKRTLRILRWTSALCLQGATCRSRSRGRVLYRDASRAAYVLGPPPSRG